MIKNYLFTSESVTEGHPDKVCDKVSDAILDEFLRGDADSRVAVETMTTTGFVGIAGEVTSKAEFDIEQLIRKTIAEIGYNDPEAVNQEGRVFGTGHADEKVNYIWVGMWDLGSNAECDTNFGDWA